MEKQSLLLSISSLLFLLFLLTSTTESVTFTCNSTSTSKCQGLVGYNSVNATTLSSIKSLFKVKSLPSLLGANNLPLSTPSSHPITAGSTFRIPIPCACSNGTGTSDHTPIYAVKSTDTGLDFIARTLFEQFVTYEEIAEVNNITNANVIKVGQKLWIPLPCSCDPVEGEEVVHLAHIVAPGSSVAAIAEKFGTKSEILLSLNGMTDPKLLQAGQVLDVPLKACSSSISNTSLDQNLLLPNGSYALTAGKCIQCSCSSSTYQLSCQPLHVHNSTTCPVTKCGNMYIGNSTTSGCNDLTCAYQGYKNSKSGLQILSSLVNVSTCIAPQPTASGNSPPNSAAVRDGLSFGWYWIQLLLLLQTAFFCSSF